MNNPLYQTICGKRTVPKESFQILHNPNRLLRNICGTINICSPGNPTIQLNELRDHQNFQRDPDDTTL